MAWGQERPAPDLAKNELGAGARTEALEFHRRASSGRLVKRKTCL